MRVPPRDRGDPWTLLWRLQLHRLPSLAPSLPQRLRYCVPAGCRPHDHPSLSGMTAADATCLALAGRAPHALGNLSMLAAGLADSKQAPLQAGLGMVRAVPCAVWGARCARRRGSGWQRPRCWWTQLPTHTSHCEHPKRCLECSWYSGHTFLLQTLLAVEPCIPTLMLPRLGQGGVEHQITWGSKSKPMVCSVGAQAAVLSQQWWLPQQGPVWHLASPQRERPEGAVAHIGIHAHGCAPCSLQPWRADVMRTVRPVGPCWSVCVYGLPAMRGVPPHKQRKAYWVLAENAWAQLVLQASVPAAECAYACSKSARSLKAKARSHSLARQGPRLAGKSCDSSWRLRHDVHDSWLWCFQWQWSMLDLHGFRACEA